MKKILILFITFLCSISNVFAEKIPVRITPAQIISTNHDEVEMGDWINFVTVNDIYINDKLYIKKGTPIYGFVDFFHPNGWAGDGAEIKFKTFKITDVNKNKMTINYPLTINGSSKKAKDIKQYIALKIVRLLRGAEIYIEPDEEVFNLFIEH